MRPKRTSLSRNYTREDFADGRQLYDVIFDTAGRRSLAHLRRGLTPHGTLDAVTP